MDPATAWSEAMKFANRPNPTVLRGTPQNAGRQGLRQDLRCHRLSGGPCSGA